MGLLLAASTASADMNAPGSREAPPVPTPGYPELLAHWALWIYQKPASLFLHSNCPMHPSCSNYAKEAVREHGAFLGSLLAADRLIHEGTEGPRSRKIWIRGRGWKADDPPKKHTVWWDHRNDQELRFP